MWRSITKAPKHQQKHNLLISAELTRPKAVIYGAYWITCSFFRPWL